MAFLVVYKGERKKFRMYERFRNKRNIIEAVEISLLSPDVGKLLFIE